MKKHLALVLAGAMTVAAITSAVYAESPAGSTVDNPVPLSWEDIDESVYDGVWFETGLGYEVYLPEAWEITDISDEEAAAGLAFRAGEEGGGANMCITCTEAPEGYTLEQAGTELAASMTVAMFADLNDIPAVIFSNDETKTQGFLFLEDGYMITGIISPPTEDDYASYDPYFQNMIESFSVTETDSDVESAAE